MAFLHNEHIYISWIMVHFAFVGICQYVDELLLVGKVCQKFPFFMLNFVSLVNVTATPACPLALL